MNGISLLVALAATVFLLCLPAAAGPARPDSAPTVDPLALEFRRQAVQRFVFNNNLTLSKLDMPGAFDLGLMHPAVPEAAEPSCAYAIDAARLSVTNARKGPASSAMFIGGVNPYATYDVEVASVSGSGAAVGVELASLDRHQRVVITSRPGAAADSITVALHTPGAPVALTTIRAGAGPDAPYTLRVQFFGVKLNVYTVKDGMTRFEGGADLLPAFRLRRRTVFGALKFNLLTRLPADGRVVISRVESYLSCGMGQADIRLITHKDGAPFITDNRLFFTLSLRGTAGGIFSTQGVFSVDPSLFDPRLEGMIVYDRGDGELRADYASHLYFDDDAGEWRGWTVGFSAQGDGSGADHSILAVRSRHDPRHGFSVMEATPMPLPAQAEDPCGVWDAEAKKWRLLVTSFERGLHAVLYESDSWNGPYVRVAGPVKEDSTGTLIQKIGGARYVFAGSSDKALHVYSYPGLKLLGDVKMDLPPFDAAHNGRVWPNIVPLPAGYPARYFALMMDRVNFPGITGANWTYGALYLYHADAPFPPMSDWYEYPQTPERPR
jgi:hypothetical protein